MSLSNHSEEINYWPSISDMFLVFFVFAFVLYINSLGGDDYVVDHVIEEYKILCKNKGLSVQNYQGETNERDAVKRPVLAKMLYEVIRMDRRKGEDRERELTEADLMSNEDQFKDLKEKIASFGCTGEVLMEAQENYNAAVCLLAWYFLQNDKYSVDRKKIFGQDSKDNRAQDIMRRINYALWNSELDNNEDGQNDEMGDLNTQIANLRTELKEKDLTIKNIEQQNKNLNKTLDERTKELDDMKRVVEQLNEKQKAVDKNSREQRVVLDEKEIQFARGKSDQFLSLNRKGKSEEVSETTIEDKLRKEVTGKIRNTCETLTEDYVGVMVEIIGHTDDTLDGGRKRAVSLEGDQCNPQLGLMRAVCIKDMIITLLGGEKGKYYYMGKHPVYFKCYSAAWLTPYSFSVAAEKGDDPNDPNKKDLSSDDQSHDNECQKNRRVEVYIRPISKPNSSENTPE